MADYTGDFHEESENHEGLGRNYAGSRGFGESGNYGGSRNYRGGRYFRGNKGFKGTRNNRESVNYGGANTTEEEGGYKVHPDENQETGAPPRDNSREEAFIARRRIKFDKEKMNYEAWENEKDWRPFMVMPRAWWRAVPPSHAAPLQHPANIVLLTYTHGRTCLDTFHCSREAKRIQNNHLQNGAVDIVYNFMIGGNGEVFEGRGWYSAPRLSHKMQRYSRNTLHVAFLGNLKDPMPNDNMLESASLLMQLGVRKHYIAPKFLEYSTKLWNFPAVPTDSEVLKNLQNFN